jgi:hypothetical protein
MIKKYGKLEEALYKRQGYPLRCQTLGLTSHEK